MCVHNSMYHCFCVSQLRNSKISKGISKHLSPRCMIYRMSFIPKLSKSRFVVPTIASALAIGSAYYMSTMTQVHNEPSKAFTNPDEWVDLKLKRKIKVSPDTHKYFFALPASDQVAGLECASLLLTKFVTEKGSNVVRPYTPISDPETKGEIEFAIKTYPLGKMTNHLESLKEGDTLAFKGPVQKFKYEPNTWKQVTLLGGGSGITPLYQLMHTIVTNPNDKTKIKLVYANKSPDDILIKDELDSLARKFPDRVIIHYFVEKYRSTWEGHTGFITKDYLKTFIPGPEVKDHRIFVCGPPGMYSAVSGTKVSPKDQGELQGFLADLGYSKDQVYKY